MYLRDLKHKIINEVDINNLLRYFSAQEIASVFGVTEDYVYKTRTLQRIQAEENFNKNIYNDTDEMKLGRVGAWKLSKERKCLNESKNEEI